MNATGSTGTFSFIISLTAASCHSRSLTHLSFRLRSETAPDGNIPNGCPALTCSIAALTPIMLSFVGAVLTLPVGVTQMKFSPRVSILERNLFTMTL